MTIIAGVVAITAGDVGAATAAIAIVRTAAPTMERSIGCETGPCYIVREGKMGTIVRVGFVTDEAHVAVAVLAVGLGCSPGSWCRS